MLTRISAIAASTVLAYALSANAAVIFSDNYSTDANPMSDHPKWVSTAGPGAPPVDGTTHKAQISAPYAVMWPVTNSPTLTLATQQVNDDNSAPGVAFPSGAGQKLILSWNTYYTAGPENIIVNLTSNGGLAAGGNGISVIRHIEGEPTSSISLSNGSTFATGNPFFNISNDQKGAGVFRLEIDQTTATLYGKLAITNQFSEVETLMVQDPATLGAGDIMLSAAHGLGAIGNVMVGIGINSYANDGNAANDYHYWSRGITLEQVVPEPATMSLLVGGLLLGLRRRK